LKGKVMKAIYLILLVVFIVNPVDGVSFARGYNAGDTAPGEPAVPPGSYTVSDPNSQNKTTLHIDVTGASPYDADGDKTQDTFTDENGNTWYLWKQHVTITGEIGGWQLCGPVNDPWLAIDENQVYSSSAKSADDGGHPGYSDDSLLLFLCPYICQCDVDNDGDLDYRRAAACIAFEAGDGDERSTGAGDVHIWADDTNFDDPPAEDHSVHTRRRDLDKTRNEESQGKGKKND